MATLSVSNTRINFSKRRPKRLSIRPRRGERNLMKHKLQEGWEETSGGNFKEPVSFFFFYNFNISLEANISYAWKDKEFSRETFFTCSTVLVFFFFFLENEFLKIHPLFIFRFFIKFYDGLFVMSLVGNSFLIKN